MTSRHNKRVSGHGNTRTVGNHDYNRDDMMSKLKSLEQEHQRLLSSHNQTEVSFNVYEYFTNVYYVCVFGFLCP